VKQIPKEQASENKALEIGSYYFSMWVVFGCSIISAVCFLVWGYFFNPDLSNIGLWGGASLCFLFALSQVTIGALRVQEKTIFAIFTRDLLWRLLAIILIYGMSFSFIKTYLAVNANSILLIMAISLLPIILWHAFYIIKYIKKRFDYVRPHYQFFSWFETSCGLALVAFISSSDLYIYTIMLGELLPEKDTGAFFASLKTVELLNLFLNTVTLIVAPQLSKLISVGNHVQLQKKCNSALVLQSIPVLIAGVIIMLFAPFFLWIFNHDFIMYDHVLRVLMLGMLVNTFTGATVLMMQLGGMHWRQVVYQGGSLLISIILLPFLVSIMGVMGAAIAFIISKVLWNISAILAIRKKLNVDPSIWGLLTINPEGLKGIISDMAPFLDKIRKK